MSERGASVALIMKGDDFVLIRRIQRAQDPWSGNFALPGGMIKAGETPEDAVLREVKEEVNLSFSRIDIRHELPVAHPVSRPQMNVHPFVIYAKEIGTPVPGDEVAEARVVSLETRLNCTNPENGFPAFDFNGWIVWGLTYRIIQSYLNYRSQKS